MSPVTVDPRRATQQARHVLETLRWPWLLFSVPYAWLWTQGLSLPVRIGTTASHALGVLAVNAWNDASDVDEGVPLHFSLVRGETGEPDGGTDRFTAPVLAGLAVITSLPLLSVEPYAPVAVGLVLAVCWLVARLPARQRYLGVPELLGPALGLALPGLALVVLTPARTPWVTIVAGTSFSLATVLAFHLRDAAGDAALGIPTVAQRYPESTPRWLWSTALVAAVAATGGLYQPLGPADQLTILAAAGFLAGLVIRRWRVPALVVAHGLYALSLLLR